MVVVVGRLLVVEDDLVIGGALRAGLAGSGHDVTWAKTGGEAESALRDAAYDLVLLDLGLPDMDGLDLCQRIRAAQPGSVIVILTARDEEIDVVLGLEAGADDYGVFVELVSTPGGSVAIRHSSILPPISDETQISTGRTAPSGDRRCRSAAPR